MNQKITFKLPVNYSVLLSNLEILFTANFTATPRDSGDTRGQH
jgi:hypothetical protein